MKRGAGVKRATPRLWLTGGLWLMAAAAWAGHGFMSSFGNIEWLPEPGETPDSAWYTLDGWEEESQLWRAGERRRPDPAVPELCPREVGRGRSDGRG